MPAKKIGKGRPKKVFILPDDDDIDIDSMPAAQIRKAYKLLQDQLKEAHRVLTTGYRCMMCGKTKTQTDQNRAFYKNFDPNCQSGVSCICKDCADKIAYRWFDEKKNKEPTKDSVKSALFYLNRPFFESVWDSALEEIHNKNAIHPPENVWKAYIHQIQMPNYTSYSFMDSDGLYSSLRVMQETERTEQTAEEIQKKKDEVMDSMEDDVKSTFLMNKKTTIRFLGYDPFENEPIEEQPILYSKLVNYFDESVREDGLKLEAVIEIVQSFKDVKTINDTISKFKQEMGDNPAVIATIKSLADTKQKMINSALALAKDNGISVNYNKQSRKGAGTLSGIIKEMNEMDLTDIEINTFDYQTSEAMSQVEANSIKNILTQLNPDENDWQREIARQTDMLWKMQDERDKAVEYCRLLRKENKDLKDFLQEKGLIDETLQVIDE